MEPGIHLLHKPEGPTSFSVVQACRAAVSARPGGRARRVCHGGTLDPFASGLLLILVEPATRLFDCLHAIPKVYHATVRWGVETDNGDPLGKVINTGDPSNLTGEQLRQALAGFVGWHDQTPHATSARRIEGERAYVRVHRGEAVVMPAGRVYLHEAAWLEHDLPRTSRLRLTVRGGYYVRALVRDLGRAVGCGAHVASLERAAIGPWRDPGAGQAVRVPAAETLPWASTRPLSRQDVEALRQGRCIPAGDLLPPAWPLPPGFPDPQAPIRGVQDGRLCFLLQPAGPGELSRMAVLPGGLD